MADSNRTKSKSKPAKPAKPYADFPLFPHDTKRWAKKIRQRMHYFGPWREDPQFYQADWQAALELYQYKNDYLQQGKTPPPMNPTALTVEQLVNEFLAHRDAKKDSGELSQRTWNDYKQVGTLLVASFGRHTTVESLTPADFGKLRESMAERLGLVALGNTIGRVKTFFTHAFKDELIERPVRMGLSFTKPSKTSVKRERETKPPKIFTIDELQAIWHAADKQMRAFVLLSLNGGLGNAGYRTTRESSYRGWLGEVPSPQNDGCTRVPFVAGDNQSHRSRPPNKAAGRTVDVSHKVWGPVVQARW